MLLYSSVQENMRRQHSRFKAAQHVVLLFPAHSKPGFNLQAAREKPEGLEVEGLFRPAGIGFGLEGLTIVNCRTVITVGKALFCLPIDFFFSFQDFVSCLYSDGKHHKCPDISLVPQRLSYMRKLVPVHPLLSKRGNRKPAEGLVAPPPPPPSSFPII